MKARILWCLPCLVCASALIASTPTRELAPCNALVQLGIFLPFAHLTAWRHDRLSYVDLAWPAGVVAIGRP